MLLKAPVAVGATLLVVGKVLERTPSKGGKTKVKIGASLEDGCSPAPGVAPTVYAEMTGLSIEGVRLPSSVPHDDVDERSWETRQAEGPGAGGGLEYRDTGWRLGNTSGEGDGSAAQ